MVLKSKAVKATALATLKNQWPGAIAAAVIPLAFFLLTINIFSLLLNVLPTLIFDVIVSVFLSITLFFVGIPLILGVLRYFWGLSLDTPISLSGVFYYFSSVTVYKRVMAFAFLLFGKLIFQSVILLLPSFIIDLAQRFSSTLFSGGVEPLWFSNIWIFSVVLRTIAICCIVYTVSRYYLAFFLFISNDSIGAADTVHKAYVISKYCEGSFVTLILSLSGWILLSVFFAPLIFTLPYILMCYIVHSRYAAVNFNLKLKDTLGGNVL